MGLSVRWVWASRVLAVGIYSHNRWRDISRGFTVWLGPVAFVWTPNSKRAA